MVASALKKNTKAMNRVVDYKLKYGKNTNRSLGETPSGTPFFTLRKDSQFDILINNPRSSKISWQSA